MALGTRDMTNPADSAELRDVLRQDPICIVDAGSRGGVQEPWASLDPDVLTVLGFEPDQDDCDKLNASAPRGWRYSPLGLWSEPVQLDVHMAEYPACSSVHPPNWQLLGRFEEQHGSPRTTQSIVRVPATTIDAFTDDTGSHPDFVKIDTQGSEYEILEGARKVMTMDATGLL